MNRPALAFSALLAGGAAIAFSPIFVRMADVGPMASAFWRVALAAPLLLMWAALSRPAARWPVDRQAGAPAAALPRKALLIAGFAFAGDLAFWHLSIFYTSVANATLLSNLAPIFVTLGAWMLFGQRVSRRFLGAMLVAFSGVALLVGPNFAPGGRALIGDAFGVITAVFYGGYMLAIKDARASGSTATVMAVSTLVTAIALAPLALAWDDRFLPASARGWLVLLGLALIPQVAGQSLIAYAMAHLPAYLSSLSLLIQPVLAAIYAVLILGEGISLMQIAGGAVVITGILLARRFG